MSNQVLTIEKIVEEYGKYYIQNAKENRSRLVRSLMQPAVTLEKNAMHVPTEDTVYRSGNYLTESVIQPFSTDFTPKGGVEFIPNTIIQRQVKTDIKIIPNEIEESWLAFLAANNCSIKDWPVVRFIMEEYVKRQIEEDRENKIVYKGVYNPASAEKVPEVCLDGIHKILTDGAAADYPINVVNKIGELDEATIFDQVEAFDAAIPSRYFSEKVIIFMAPEYARAYLANKREKGYYNIKSDDEINLAIDFSKHMIFASPAMAGTKHIWATVPRNLLWLTKRYQPISNMQMQVEDRYVKLLLDWWEGIGFRCNQMVWASEATIGASATDTASPSNGIVVRTINPVLTGAVAGDTTVDVTAKVLGELPEGATVRVAYGTTSSLGSTADMTQGEDGGFYAQLTGLTRNTKHYLEVQVVVGDDVYSGVKAEVKTLTTAPSLTALAMSDITTTTAKATLTYSDPSNLVDGGGVEITTDLAETPTNVNGSPSAGTMAVNLTSLTLSTTYYVRAYVKVGTEKTYTSWSTFATPAT